MTDGGYVAGLTEDLRVGSSILPLPTSFDTEAALFVAAFNSASSGYMRAVRAAF
jgi:hypothetical protein